MKPISFMPHQERTLEQTEDRDRVAYYLDMGLGKTFVGAEKMWRLNTAVNLLICQKSKIPDWIDHFTEYYGSDFQVYDLTKKAAMAEFQNRVGSNIGEGQQVLGVINYEMAFRRPYIAQMTGFTLMLDESSLIQNENAKRSKFILRLAADNVILLSGTPTSGKYERLWSQAKLLGWDIRKRVFWNSYIVTKWVEESGSGFKHEVVTGYKNVDHLKQKLAEHGAVFMKSEEVLDLPEQIEQEITVQPPKEYRKFLADSYLVFDTQTMTQYTGDDVEHTPTAVELVGDNALTKLLYARQLCGQYSKMKLQALRDLAESTEDRLVIFYNFDEELRQMESHLSELCRPYSWVNGKKKDLTAYEQSDDSVTFVQYQAGAMGLNLQKANKVIYYTLPLGKGSCDLWEQSKKRIHRIGQNRTCFYYYLLCKGTVEIRNLGYLRIGKEYTDELFRKEGTT